MFHRFPDGILNGLHPSGSTGVATRLPRLAGPGKEGFWGSRRCGQRMLLCILSSAAMNVTIWISQNYNLDNLPPPHSFADKVNIFYDRWLSWKFQIVDKFLNGYKRDAQDIPPIPGAGYAALDIIFSYFETVGKYTKGYCDTARSTI